MPIQTPSNVAFPAVESALDDPNGLLAMGGDLSTERLMTAYSLGIFPWYEQDQPLLWWSPNPRAVVYPEKVHVAKSLKKTMRRYNYGLSINRAFDQVVAACADPRKETVGTWITQEMQDAYGKLHRAGHAHSLEVWEGDELVGGIYGVTSGRVFSGESMFHRRTDTSKIAFVALCKQLQHWGWKLLDCQINNPHLRSLGSEEIPRTVFKTMLPGYSSNPTRSANYWGEASWKDTAELLDALT